MSFDTKPKNGKKGDLCYMNTDKKKMIFTKILQKRLKQDLTLQIMN